jgi:hypothetical protein
MNFVTRAKLITTAAVALAAVISTVAHADTIFINGLLPPALKFTPMGNGSGGSHRFCLDDSVLRHGYVRAGYGASLIWPNELHDG